MRKFTLLVAFLLLAGMQAVLAQFEVKGTVTDLKTGEPLPGVSIIVRGTLSGTITDIDGKYVVKVPEGYNELIFSFVGMLTREIKIDGRALIDVSLEEDVVGLDEVVITALGVSREKKSLGYATQEVTGNELSIVKRDNFISNLSGKAAGVQIKNSGNFGGSTNIVIRGSSSLTGNNQALFVIDGVPMNNDNVNLRDQLRGRSGYDYGNASADLNANDIESVNILKGAAATALYGSRAANGAIIITTKKGERAITKRRVWGVTLSSNVTAGFMDKTTFPEYQQNYGGGYGRTWYSETEHPGLEYIYDINGDGQIDYTVPTYEDASLGEKFDPNLMVYQYDAFYPESPNYQTATPWIKAANGPEYFIQKPLAFTNNIEVMGGGENATFRLSYSNVNQTGLLPNSELKKNSILMNGSYDIMRNLTVSSSINYVRTDGLGRNSTGYSDNIMSSFRQWMQTNVDYKQQKELYNLNHNNISWNPVSPYDLAIPAYWDNPYFQRHQNYESDYRDRILGYVMVDWKITGYLSAMARYSVDTYSELQEERKAMGSSAGEFGVGGPGNPRSEVTSGYSRFSRNFYERNFDLMLKLNKNFGENFNLSAMLGSNIMRSGVDQVFASTDGGLIVPGMFSLANSVNAQRPPEELYTQTGVNGTYGQVSLGFKDVVFLDATLRNDVSSTLPKKHWSYWYPSISGSFLFSNLLDADWLQLGKFRLGYAEVGNYAPWGSIIDTYSQNTNWGTTALFTLPNDKQNEGLKPERTRSIEAGLEMTFLQKRLGFDFAFYKNNTVDQIMPVAVSFVTGYSGKYVNAGEVQNLGYELQLFGAPVVKPDFRWDITLNWAKNNNEVVSLAEGVENLQIANLQGGVSINARKGEPYGAIQGTDFVYLDGEKIIKANGYYQKSSTSDIVIGNIQPDWIAGLNNKFTYKNWAFSFLIDMQQGGDIFSLDLWYGMATGLYPETDELNHLGNPARDPIVQNEDGTYASNSGGILLEGVLADGTPNTQMVPGDDVYVYGYVTNPNKKFIYDASYVKLREVVLTYSLPDKVINKQKVLNGVSFSLVGSNLWIIHKNLPYADPEASQSSGNIQGWQSGVMPTTRNIGLTVSLQF